MKKAEQLDPTLSTSGHRKVAKRIAVRGERRARKRDPENAPKRARVCGVRHVKARTAKKRYARAVRRLHIGRRQERGHHVLGTYFRGLIDHALHDGRMYVRQNVRLVRAVDHIELTIRQVAEYEEALEGANP